MQMQASVIFGINSLILQILANSQITKTMCYWIEMAHNRLWSSNIIMMVLKKNNVWNKSRSILFLIKNNTRKYYRNESKHDIWAYINVPIIIYIHLDYVTLNLIRTCICIIYYHSKWEHIHFSVHWWCQQAHQMPYSKINEHIKANLRISIYYYILYILFVCLFVCMYAYACMYNNRIIIITAFELLCLFNILFDMLGTHAMDGKIKSKRMWAGELSVFLCTSTLWKCICGMFLLSVNRNMICCIICGMTRNITVCYNYYYYESSLEFVAVIPPSRLYIWTYMLMTYDYYYLNNNN